MTKIDEQNVDSWIEIEEDKKNHIKTALENASRVFDNNDGFTVNILEAIYGQESSFGANIVKDIKGSKGAVGHFQMEKSTAEKYSKFNITKSNDPRFDIDNSSFYAALYLVDLNKLFSKNSNLGNGILTISISDIIERKIFAIAAYNAGEGRIARAQMLAKEDAKDPTKWEDVKSYLKEAGASDDKVKEISEYVEAVLEYEKIFTKKSKANQKLKDKEPLKMSEEGTHWITLKDGRHVFVGEKKA